MYFQVINLVPGTCALSSAPVIKFSLLRYCDSRIKFGKNLHMSLQMSVEKATSVPTDVGSKSYIYQTDRCRFSNSMRSPPVIVAASTIPVPVVVYL